MKLELYILILASLVLKSCGLGGENPTTLDSKCDLNSYQDFPVDAIVTELILDLKNETVREHFSELIRSTKTSLQKVKTDEQALWPHTEIDSCYFFEYEQWDGNMHNHELKDRRLKSVIKLCDKKLIAIRHLMNNPTFFSFAECGTAVPEAKIEFYGNGTIVGVIEFACNFGQTSSIPMNKHNKFGGLNEEGNVVLDSIRPWE